MKLKNFKISIKSLDLSHEEKRRILHQVFDILFSIKKKGDKNLNRKIEDEVNYKD